jgi:hypothetical protein
MAAALGTPIPADRQLDFLRRVGRILDEGRFTTTYKFALLVALANLSVKHGADDDRRLELALPMIAREFADLHWGMSRPFGSQHGKVLRFATDKRKQASVILAVASHAATGRATHARERRYRSAEDALLRSIATTIRRDVLYRLQAVGPASSSGAAPADQFLYEHPADPRECGRMQSIVLKPGVAACFRSLAQVVVPMVQARWALWVRRNNPEICPDAEVETFLFGSPRINLLEHARPLYELQRGRCFYTGARLRSTADGAVDHFLPRARYALDDPLNLVLAKKTVNGSKRDFLASERHLEAWRLRNSDLPALGWPESADSSRHAGAATWQSTRRLAAWLYAAADRDGMHAWDAPNRLTRLTGAWRSMLVDAA